MNSSSISRPDARDAKLRAEGSGASEAGLIGLAVEALNGLDDAIGDACQILNVTKQEWEAEGQWSDWDAATLAKVTAARIRAREVLTALKRGEA